MTSECTFPISTSAVICNFISVLKLCHDLSNQHRSTPLCKDCLPPLFATFYLNSLISPTFHPPPTPASLPVPSTCVEVHLWLISSSPWGLVLQGGIHYSAGLNNRGQASTTAAMQQIDNTAHQIIHDGGLEGRRSLKLNGN